MGMFDDIISAPGKGNLGGAKPSQEIRPDNMFNDILTGGNQQAAPTLKPTPAPDNMFSDIVQAPVPQPAQPEAVEADASVPFGSVARGFLNRIEGGAGLGIDVGAVSPETGTSVMQWSERMKQYVPIPEEHQQAVQQLEEANKDISWWNPTWAANTFKWAITNPSAFASVTGESLGSSVGSIATSIAGGMGGGAVAGPPGALTGATAGLLGGSSIEGYTDAMREFMQQKGLDPLQPESWKKLQSDPELMSEARWYSAKQGVAQGVFDAATMFIGGKGFGRFAHGKLRQALGSRVGGRIPATPTEFLANTALEGVGGAAGYGVGQALTGQDISGAQLGLEFLGEFGGGAPFAAAQVAIDRAIQRKGRPLTPEEIAALTKEGLVPPPEEPTVTPYKEAVAEGRTWFGVASPDGKIDTLVSTDYTPIETNYARRASDSPNSYMIAARPEEVTETAAVVEQNIKDGKDVQALSVNSKITPEEFQTKLRNVPASMSFKDYYKTLTDVGLRVTPETDVATFVGNAPHNRIQPLQEAPVNPRAVGFYTREGSAIQINDPAVRGYDLNKMVQNTDHFVSVWEPVLRTANIRTPIESMLDVRDPGLKQILEQKGWQGLLDEVTQAQDVNLPNNMRQQHIDELFASGALKVKPNAAFWHAYGTDALMAEPALRYIKKDTKAVPTLEDAQTIASAFQPTTKIQAGAHGRSVFPGIIGWHQQYHLPPNSLVPTPKLKFVDKVSIAYSNNTTKEQKRYVEAAASVIRQMVKKLDVDELHIIFGQREEASDFNPYYKGGIHRSAFAGGNSTGVMNMFGPKKYSIHIRGDLRNIRILELAGHEFGHVISAAHFSSASFETQSRVFGAYRRFIHELQSVGDNATARKDVLRRHAMAIEERGSLSIDATYFTSFEEWFANQVARWIESDARPLSVLGRLFHDIGKRILSVIKVMRQMGRHQYLGATAEMHQYLNSFLTDGKPQWLAPVRTWYDTKTRATNYKAGVTAPLQEETAANYAMLEKYGPRPLGVKHDLADPAMANVSPPQLDKAMSDHFNWLYKFSLNFRQLAALNAHIPELQLYAEYIERMQLDANRIMATAEVRLKAMKELARHRNPDGTTQADSLGKFVFEMNEMSYLTAEERTRGVRRWPTEAERAALLQKHQVGPQAFAVYEAMRKDFDAVITRTEELATKEAFHVYDNPIDIAKAVQEAQARSRELRKAPYFPQTRFGKWGVTVRNADGKLEAYYTFESKGEQKREAEALSKSFPDMSVVTSTLPEDMAPFQGMPAWFLDRMAQMPGMSPKQKAWLEQLRFEAAPATSFRKHLMKRKGVEGYSRDMQRSFAKYFFHHARNYARLKYQREATIQINSLQQSRNTEAQLGQVVDVNKRTEIANYMQNHLNEVMNPSRDWSLFRSVIAVMHLGFNVAAASLNLSQIPVMSYSYLGAKFGDASTVKHLTKATTDLKTYYKRGSYEGMTNPEMRAMDWLIKENLITESMAAELAALSTGGHIMSPGFATNAIQSGWIKFTEYAMYMFQTVEQVNRRITARAAYRLGMEQYQHKWVNELKEQHLLTYRDLLNKGFTDREAGALLVAKQTIYDTQYDYSKVARPRFMRGKAGILFAFYSFTQNTVFTLLNPQNKGIMIRYALIMFALAGAKGLVPDDVEDILNFIGRKSLSPDFDIERETRRFLANYMDPENSDLVLHGTGRYGFGLPAVMHAAGVNWWPSVERSRSVELGRILPLPVTGLLDPNKTYDQLLTENTQQIAGAGYGYGAAMLQAITDNELDWGDRKRWERVMPTFLRNISQSTRMWQEGGVRDRTFNIALEFDKNDPAQRAEMIAKGLGYMPTRLSQYYDAQTAKYETQAYWRMGREHLLDRAYRARYFYKDTDDYKRILKEISDYNRAVPDHKLHITAKTLARSAKTRLQRGQQKRLGLEQNVSPAVVREIDQLYPGAVHAQKVKQLK